MARKTKQKKRGKRNIWGVLKYTLPIFILGTSVYVFRAEINNFYTNICHEIACASGFCVESINISGASKRTQKLIHNEIGITQRDSIFKLSAKEIAQNISKISWVKSIVVQKNLPNYINIKIEERKPIAIFQHDSKSTLIDEEGNFIEDVNSGHKGIPIISGENAHKKANEILTIISKYPLLQEKLESLVFVRERRWNISISGVKILLPENNIENALEILSIILKTEKLNKKTVNQIDLRSPENVVFQGVKFSDRKDI